MTRLATHVYAMPKKYLGVLCQPAWRLSSYTVFLESIQAIHSSLTVHEPSTYGFDLTLLVLYRFAFFYQIQPLLFQKSSLVGPLLSFGFVFKLAHLDWYQQEIYCLLCSTIFQ